MKWLIVSLSLLFVVVVTGCEELIDAANGGDPPIVAAFVVEPNNGPAPLLSAVSWSAADPEGEQVVCKIDFQDGKVEEVANCGQITSVFHTFAEPGGYVVSIEVSDGKNTTTKTFPVTVQAAQTE